MFVNHVVVNGVDFIVAFVRTGENGLTFEGMTPSGETAKVEVSFTDGMVLSVDSAKTAAQPKQRKPRKAKAAAPVAEVAEVAEVEHTEADYQAYLTQNPGKRGRKPEWVRKFAAK